MKASSKGLGELHWITNKESIIQQGRIDCGALGIRRLLVLPQIFLIKNGQYVQLPDR